MPSSLDYLREEIEIKSFNRRENDKRIMDIEKLLKQRITS